MSRAGLILVVDDDADIRETLAEILVEQGFEVRTASNGREALTILQEGLSPSLVLLDVMMPVMDGWEFREEQLRIPEFARIPVVVLSAHSNHSETMEKTKPAALLQKPLRLHELLATLRRVLEAPILAGRVEGAMT